MSEFKSLIQTVGRVVLETVIETLETNDLSENNERQLISRGSAPEDIDIKGNVFCLNTNYTIIKNNTNPSEVYLYGNLEGTFAGLGYQVPDYNYTNYKGTDITGIDSSKMKGGKPPVLDLGYYATGSRTTSQEPQFNGNAATATTATTASAAVPGSDLDLALNNSFKDGMIMMWTGSIAPSGWALCDGNNGTPDLRGRFVLSSTYSNDVIFESDPLTANYTVGDTGGEQVVTLTEDEMPTHSHQWGLEPKQFIQQTKNNDNAILPGSNSTPYKGIKTDEGYFNNLTGIYNSGGDEPHENRPPYYVLAYIMKVSGDPDPTPTPTPPTPDPTPITPLANTLYIRQNNKGDVQSSGDLATWSNLTFPVTISSTSQKNVTLTTSLNLTNVKTYFEIKVDDFTFDGLNNSIFLNDIQSYAGLFSNVENNNSVIKNIYVTASKSSTLDLSKNSGWLVQGGSYNNSSGNKIDNVNVDADIDTPASTTGSPLLGGLVGGKSVNNSELTITNCSYIGNMGSGTNTNIATIGGILGSSSAFNGSTVNITNCFTSGDLYVNGGNLVGSGCGTGTNTKLSIDRCYTTGSQKNSYPSVNPSEGSYSAGLLVGNESPNNSGGEVTITNSYTTGDITGSNGGGLVGGYTQPINMDTWTIKNCYTKVKEFGSGNTISNSNSVLENNYFKYGSWSDSDANTNNLNSDSAYDTTRTNSDGSWKLKWQQ